LSVFGVLSSKLRHNKDRKDFVMRKVVLSLAMSVDTYEVGLKEGITNPYPTLQQYVFSSTMQESPDAQVTLVSGDAVDFVRILKQDEGKAIWLCGGATLATTLYRADLVDRLIVKVNPVLFGSGIPLFLCVVKQAKLELAEHKIYPSGHMVLHYHVCR
jgi:dihydrofolate reductase